MSHLISAQFLFWFFSKKLLPYIRKRKFQMRQAFRTEHFFLFTEGIKVIENPRSDLLSISQWQSTTTASNKLIQQISSQFHFPPQPGNTFAHRSVSRFTLLFQHWVSASSQREKGIFGAGVSLVRHPLQQTPRIWAGRGIAGMELLLYLQKISWTCLKNALH